MSHIYVMTHKKVNNIPDDGFYVPLHVGRDLGEDLGYLADNTGDSISGKNRNYCELTGLYWLWKNGPEDITGICHYRRYFIYDDAIITKDKVEEILNDADIIIPGSGRVHAQTVYENYGNVHFSKDLDTCRAVIADLYPMYLKAFDRAMNSTYMTYANMFICRKDVYDSYCKWLFDVLFEVERRTDISDYDQYQARIYGFLSERLLRVWLFMQELKVFECETLDIEPDNFDNDKKTIDLKYKLLKARLGQLIGLYENGALLKESLIPEFNCQDDFEGKIPVWFAWWQGFDEMPEVVRICYESLVKNLPANATFRFISLENVMEYVTFSDSVINGFNEGKITFAMLSAFLRAELLYRYGGMWVDASCLVTSPISAELLDAAFAGKKLFTLRYDNSIFSADITKGRWSKNLWATASRQLLFKFWAEAMNFYFEVTGEIPDYEQVDYIIALACEIFPEIELKLLENKQVSNDVLEFVENINYRVTEERLSKLEENQFCKLTCRKDYKSSTLAKDETMYSVIKARYLG